MVELENLKNSLPQFAVLHHFCDEFKNIISTSENNCQTANTLMELYKTKWKNAGQRAAEILISEIDFLGKTVLLHSNSSNIISLFELLNQKGIQPLVIQTISFPIEEGKVQAEILARMGFKVSIVGDASSSQFVKMADFVIMGADRIFRSEFINKTGSLPLALACQHYNKPLFVISDSRKFFRYSLYNKPIDLEQMENPEELWVNPPKGIQILNYHFEHIPNHFVKRFYFENGGYLLQ